MSLKIKEIGLDKLDEILDMRMEVLSNVFKEDYEKMSELEWQNLREENRLYYEKNLNNGGHIDCFAYVDDILAGSGGICLYNEMPSPDNQNGKCGYLMNIYVREQFRNLGIGTEITNWLIEKAKEKDVTKIYLESSVCAKNMYQEIGFSDMKDYMILGNKVLCKK